MHHHPQNSSLESLTPSGLTPAQAYQAQIYLDNPTGIQPDWNTYQNSPGPSNQNGTPTRPPDPPRLGVSLDHNNGRLGLDFVPPVGNGGSTNSSPQDTDESSSELPWMRAEASGAIIRHAAISIPDITIAISKPRYDQPRHSDPVGCHLSHFMPSLIFPF